MPYTYPFLTSSDWIIRYLSYCSNALEILEIFKGVRRHGREGIKLFLRITYAATNICEFSSAKVSVAQSTWLYVKFETIFTILWDVGESIVSFVLEEFDCL